jgi:hypothetical protein
MTHVIVMAKPSMEIDVGTDTDTTRSTTALLDVNR